MKGRNQSESAAEDVGKRKQDSPPLIPPDGGWGWAVVFGNFLSTFMRSSIESCVGIVFVYLVQSGYSNTEVAIIPAILNALTNLLAPLSTGLSRFYSHRRLATIGILMISTGLFMCSFYDHIIWFYICYGIILGIGNALVAPQGFLICQKYFQQRPVAANALSLSGSSFGIMLLPLMINYFVEEYSYQGTFILWSGIVLHGLIGSSLFQPLKWHMKRQKTNPLGYIMLHQKNEDPTEILPKDSDGDTAKGTDSCEKDSLVNPNTKTCEVFDGGSYSSSSIDVDQGTFNERRNSVKRVRELKDRISYSSKSSINFIESDIIKSSGSCSSVQAESKEVNEEIMEKKSEAKEIEAADHCLCCDIKFPKIRDMIKLKLFTYPAFLIASLSSVSNRLVYSCFVTYLPSIARDMNIGKYAPYLFTCIAVSELLAKVFMSLVSDLGIIPRHYFVVIFSAISSVVIFCITFTSEFWGLAACCSCFGFCLGGQTSVSPVLLVEYLGLKLLPFALGLLLFMNGIGGLIMFVSTGLLNDIMGNYLVTYWAIGCLTLVPGILWSMITCFTKNTPPEIGRSSA